MQIAAAILTLSTVVACGDKKQADGAGGPGGAGMPPPEVGVVAVQPQSIAIATELPGRLEATRIAEIRARVPGIVQKREFREGSDVKAGQVLFRIDAAPYQAAYESAQAALARAEANLTQASLKVERYQPLVATNAISKQEYDDAVAAKKQAAADVVAARAQRTTAQLNRGYATVTAPISGRIGRAEVTEGALVGQGEATKLATIQQIDPIYVNLTQSSSEVLRLRNALASGQLKQLGPNEVKVNLVTDDGQIYPHPGKLLFSDLSVDPGTGSITLRAEFPNPGGQLLPGMYVRARLEQGVKSGAIAVPQQALQRSPEGASVMVIGADGMVAVRPVKTDGSQNNQWIISEGLKAGDRVIVEGLQKVRPGAPAKAVPWTADASAGSAAQAPAAQPAKR